MTKRMIVLSELAALREFNHRSTHDGWWLPYHVRYFRSESPLHEAGVNFEAVKNHLRALHLDGLCERRLDGRQYVYRVSDKGLVVLEQEKERASGTRRLRVYGDVVAESQDERGPYAIIEQRENTA